MGIMQYLLLSRLPSPLLCLFLGPLQTSRSLVRVLALQSADPRAALPTLDRAPIPTVVTELSLRWACSRRRRGKALAVWQRRRTEQGIKRRAVQRRRHRTGHIEQRIV